MTRPFWSRRYQPNYWQERLSPAGQEFVRLFVVAVIALMVGFALVPFVMWGAQ